MGGIVVMPGSQGGTNWYSPSYSPRTGLVYLSVWDNYQALSSKQPYNRWKPGQLYTGGGWWPGLGEKGPPADWPPRVPPPSPCTAHPGRCQLQNRG